MNKMTKKSELPEGLKSLQLELENFKNLKKKIVKLNGMSALFIGRNGSGKSSLIQAMISPMDAKVRPSEAITIGEDRARVTHKIGGVIGGVYKEYTLDLHFTHKDKAGRLVITNENGETMKSPSTLIKSIIGNISFDVTKWMHEDKKKKLEIIKNLTGCGKAIDAITYEIRDKKEEIKHDKDRISNLEGALANHEFTPEQIDLYSTPANIDALKEQMATVSKNQATWDKIKNDVASFRMEIQNSNRVIQAANIEIEKLMKAIEDKKAEITHQQAYIAQVEGDIDVREKWLNSTPRPSIEEINNSLNEAISHNEKHNRVKMLSEQSKEVIKLKDSLSTKEDEIKALEKKRSDIISGSQLPIPGLRFDDNEIYIDELPLEDGQINTARIIDISVEIAMALNPTLKVIFIHDGSLFDKEGLKNLIEKIESRGYMAIIEMVDYDGGDLEVKFTEQELK